MTGLVRPAALHPGVRALRIAAFGSSSLLLAAGAHRLGGGALPPTGVLVVAAIGLGLLALPLTSRRVRLRLLLPVLLVQQFLLHGVFGAVGSGRVCVLPGASHHDAALGACSAGHSVLAGGHSWPMWLGHAAAVLATAWLLARGECWLWRVADGIVRAVGPALTAPIFAPTPAVRPVRIRAAGARPAGPLPPRGPPA